MNTISYKELRDWYIDNNDAKANAKKYFGDKQPSIYRTGFYSSPSWNWGYHIGLVGVPDPKDDSSEAVITWFEVVTQFGAVVAARKANIPLLREN